MAGRKSAVVSETFIRSVPKRIEPSESVFNANRFTAKKNLRSQIPSVRNFWPDGQTLKLLFQPADVP